MSMVKRILECCDCWKKLGIYRVQLYCVSRSQMYHLRNGNYWFFGVFWRVSVSNYKKNGRSHSCLRSSVYRISRKRSMWLLGSAQLKRFVEDSIYLCTDVICLFWWEPIDGWLYLTDDFFLWNFIIRRYCKVKALGKCRDRNRRQVFQPTKVTLY